MGYWKDVKERGCEVKIVEIVWLREGNSTLRE